MPRLVLSLLCVLAAMAASPVWAQLPGEAAASARIQPGDSIIVRIYREPALSGTVGVSADGDIVLPRLGAVRAVQHTAGSLQDTLRTLFAAYFRDPTVEVAVLRRVGVHGQVAKPDLYMVDLTMTLRDVIAKAGGITDEGDPKRISIVRGDQRIEVGREPGAQLAIIALHSGDQIVVGRRSWLARNYGTAIGTTATIVSLFIGVVQLLDK